MVKHNYTHRNSVSGNLSVSGAGLKPLAENLAALLSGFFSRSGFQIAAPCLPRAWSIRALIFAELAISCSHTLITVHPSWRNLRLWDFANATLRLIFLLQYSRFVLGNFLRQEGQPCQKQPSINTATRRSINATSGLPVMFSTFFFQPFKPILASMANRRISSFVPLPLTDCIVFRRSSGLRLSLILQQKGLRVGQSVFGQRRPIFG